MRLGAIIFLLFITSSYVQAQPPYVADNQGRFTISDIKGCAPFTVTVTISAPCGPGYSCTANYGDGVFTNVPADGDTIITYNEPGIYEIEIVFATEGSDKIKFEVTENIPPEFDIYSCGNNSVQIKVTDDHYDEYRIDFNDGNTVTVPAGANATATHTYAASGNKTISVWGRNLNASDNCDEKLKGINATPTLPSRRIDQLTVLDNTRIQLDFEEGALFENIIYRLEISQNNGATFQQLQNIYNVNSIILENLRPDDHYYCFRLAPYNPCDNIVSYPGGNIICSANFDLTIQNNNNRLNWSTFSSGISNFSISKNPGNVISVDPTSNVYDDTDINCGTEYAYQLTSLYADGARSISLPKSGVALSDDIPSVINNISTIVTDQGLNLVWPQDPAFTPEKYAILKSENNNFIPHGESEIPAYTDIEYISEAGPCYKISYNDVCGNTSPVSNEVCPLQLTGTLEPDNDVNLTWNDYNGWTNGVQHYIIEQYNETGEMIQTFGPTTTTTLLDETEDPLNQTYVYRVIAYPNEAGLEPSVSNIITIIKEPNLYYPTAFTPNNDGLNDIFLVFSQYTAAFELKIFNRWGEMMFITNELNSGWDGTFKGNKMPEGTYVFTARITDLTGRSFDRSGTVVLLKN